VIENKTVKYYMYLQLLSDWNTLRPIRAQSSSLSVLIRLLHAKHQLGDWAFVSLVRSLHLDVIYFNVSSEVNFGSSANAPFPSECVSVAKNNNVVNCHVPIF